MESYMLKEIKEQPQAVKNTLIKNKETIDRVVSCIKKQPINLAYLVARGTSDHGGIYAKYLGEYYLGIPVCLTASSIINLYQRNMKLTSALTIAISQSGEGPDVIGVIKETNRQKSLSVAVTNNETSTLAKEAEHSLFCYAGPEKSVAATKTCTTSMMAMAALIQEWSGENGHLNQIPEAITKTLSYFDEIGTKVQPFKNAESCVVLARGFNYACALETALKIQETCYVNARGFSTADFQHGPIAMLHQGFPVIVYAFKGPAMSGVPELLSYLKQIGTHTLLVTNEQTLLKESTEHIYIQEDYPEEITPYISVVFGQIFAYHLALAKGLNPDAPRGLHKVTKTL
ncbi:MAG TPA: glutamine--fructose-6-phosphate aminotransferase [Firmicutes bacterium]|jgi:glutamine---fructose-6-phosphate transaminase (isomerizing)|nr:glutamine--fructose-6-phosphate aminotransferase [Bacillota bacterium]